jgi:hypothetical protein
MKMNNVQNQHTCFPSKCAGWHVSVSMTVAYAETSVKHGTMPFGTLLLSTTAWQGFRKGWNTYYSSIFEPVTAQSLRRRRLGRKRAALCFIGVNVTRTLRTCLAP